MILSPAGKAVVVLALEEVDRDRDGFRSMSLPVSPDRRASDSRMVRQHTCE